MTDSATDRGMVDATETDLALRRLEVVIPELENRWGALHPPGVEGNAEPSSEATDDVRKSCDEFQEIVNCLVEAQQHRPERPPFATDYDALYSRLRAIGRVEAKWKRLKEATDNLVLLHGRHLLQNGFYPNDLEYILTRQLAHCYQPLNPPLQGYRRYLRNLIDTMDRAKARPPPREYSFLKRSRVFRIPASHVAGSALWPHLSFSITSMWISNPIPLRV